MTTSIFFQVLWTGVTYSTFYMLYSVSFALYLKVTKVWNFAQAGSIAIAYTALFFAHRSLGLTSPFSLAIAVLVVILVNCAVEWWGFRLLRRRSAHHLTFFIFSFMAAEFLIYGSTLALGTEPQSLSPMLFPPSWRVFGIVVTQWDVDALIITVALLLVCWLVLWKSRLGRNLQAVADNAALAQMFRIKPERIFLVTTSVCAVLVVLGTWLYGTKAALVPKTSLDLVLVAVIATILGGVGSIAGAAISALMLGIVKGFSIFVVPSIWQSALIYYLLFAVIVIAPRGFGGLTARRAAAVKAPSASAKGVE